MYVRFNYRCPNCREEEERFVKKDVMDAQTCCRKDTVMTRLPAAPATHFRFNDKKLKG